MIAVSGSALMTGCTKSGNRWAEKKTPETIHIGIITVFISPDAASMVRARDAINNPSALNDSEPSTHSSARPAQRAAHGHAEHQRAETQHHAHFHHQQQQPRKHERQQVVMPRHGRGHQALHEVLAAGIHDGESHAPDGAAHQIHPQQAGDQEIDIARPRLAHELVGEGNRIDAAGGPLDRAIRQQARRAAFGIGVVIAVDHAAAGPGAASSATLPARNASSAAAAGNCCHIEELILAERLRQLRRDGGDFEHVRGAVAEGDAEAGGQQDGEDEYPEQGFRLAHEFQKPHQRQLRQRMLPPGRPAAEISGGLAGSEIGDGDFTHRANAVPSG